MKTKAPLARVKSVAPSAPPLARTLKEVEDRVIEQYSNTVSESRDSIQKFTTRMLEGGPAQALSELAWAENFAENLATAALRQKVLAIYAERSKDVENPMTLLEVLKAVRDDARDGLLNDRWTESSTSKFSNSCAAAERRAAARFVQHVEITIYRLEDAAAVTLDQSRYA